MFFKLQILPYIIYYLHRLLACTWRLELSAEAQLDQDIAGGQTVIFAHWHKDETVLPIDIRRYNAGILNSKSSDGQMMAKVVRLYGAKTAKGSSSRDGVEALKGLVRLALKDGCNPAVAIDGPRGPYKKVKPGVFQLSRLTKARIYPAAVIFDRAWHFPKAWDKTYLPKPFARVRIHWGQPMDPVSKKEDPKSPDLAQRLVDKMNAAEAQAANLFTRQSSQC